jgi:hypothetical protein
MLNLWKYNILTNAAPTIVDTVEAVAIGYAQFISGTPCLFVDDCLVHYQNTSGTGICPVLRMVGDTPRIGFIGGYSASTTQVIQRLSPNKQVLVCGSVTSGASYAINRVPAMALSQLLLPEPIVKSDKLRLSVSYTISIQD